MTIISGEMINAWASSPYAILMLSVFSFSESAFFIIPPEVLLIPMALANPAMALIYGLITTVASVLGAGLGFLIGKKGGKPILEKLFSDKKIEAVRKMFHKYDTGAILMAAFTPIPFKVFTIAAGVFDLDFWKFIITSFIGRGTRYMIIAGLIFFFGESIRYFLENQFDKAVLLLTIIVIAAAGIYKLVLPFVEQKLLKQSLKDKLVSLFQKP